MPIFEYRCRECGELFEWLQSRADDVPSGCPRCHATEVARQLSVFAVTSQHTTAPPGPCGSADCACRRAS
jgi:putative FmdB family regulatory protein